MQGEVDRRDQIIFEANSVFAEIEHALKHNIMALGDMLSQMRQESKSENELSSDKVKNIKYTIVDKVRLEYRCLLDFRKVT